MFALAFNWNLRNFALRYFVGEKRVQGGILTLQYGIAIATSNDELDEYRRCCPQEAFQGFHENSQMPTETFSSDETHQEYTAQLFLRTTVHLYMFCGTLAYDYGYHGAECHGVGHAHLADLSGGAANIQLRLCV